MSGVRTIKCPFGNEGGQICNEAFTEFGLHTVIILMDTTWYNRYLISLSELRVLP